MTLHVGILGGGGISDTHARAASELEGVRIVGIAGTNAARVSALAERHDALAFGDLASLLHHRPLDVLLIGTPSALHADAGIAAARAGIHVLTEKPLDVTTAKADALITACAAASVKLGVFFQDRFAPDMARLKSVIDEGTLGRPLLGSARVKWWRPFEYYTGSRWRGTHALDGGGAVINQGIHTIDLLLWLWGDIKRVFARKTTFVHKVEVEDTMVATFEFKNGALMTFEATTAAYPGFPRQIELTFDQGTVTIQQDRITSTAMKTAVLEVSGERSNTNPAASSAMVSDVRGHKAAIADFILAIRENAEPRCNGVDGRRSVAVVEALYRSAATSLPVDV